MLKSYDVVFTKTRTSYFRVEARNEEEARIVGENFLRKDRAWDGEHDPMIEFKGVYDSAETEVREDINFSEYGQFRCVYRKYDGL